MFLLHIFLKEINPFSAVCQYDMSISVEFRFLLRGVLCTAEGPTFNCYILEALQGGVLRSPLASEFDPLLPAP